MIESKMEHSERIIAPRRFRRKPIIVEAWQWDGKAARPRLKGPEVMRTTEERLLNTTHESVTIAQKGDWFVRGVLGELYPVKPDIFVKLYEAADA